MRLKSTISVPRSKFIQRWKQADQNQFTRSLRITSNITIRPRQNHDGSNFPDPKYLMDRLATFSSPCAVICIFPP
ncbi:hypothetical protein Pdw03_3784 [Penicillium digitatum]|uniref:Uncharacterized protein n=1 Tax=Penicillium digitatum TaxID=36651 RepID=A0A7T6XGW5_PENDI|nr:hypothetical protein Pdw03_3784 [Penicillium digitatum]